MGEGGRCACSKVQGSNPVMVVLRKTSNLKMLMRYVRKPCSDASIVGDPSVAPKKKGFLAGNKAELKSVSFIYFLKCRNLFIQNHAITKKI